MAREKSSFHMKMTVNLLGYSVYILLLLWYNKIQKVKHG